MTQGVQRHRGTSGSPRICIVYDCRYPHTFGGAEKWLLSLARSLGRGGARVTYVHGAGRGEEVEGAIRWCGLSDASDLYTRRGVRRIWPALRFAGGVARFLRAHHREFDLVYVHDMPIFPVIGAWWGLRGTGTPWVVEWIEWWDRPNWRRYLGAARGTVGYVMQRVALAVTPRAACFSDLTARALHSVRPRLPVARLAGQIDSEMAIPSEARDRASLATPPEPPLAVFVGRFVRHKRPDLAIDAVLSARTRLPGLQMILIGGGPGEGALRDRVKPYRGVIKVISNPPDAVVSDVLSRASVLVHPSEREGFGLAVAEANSLGVPAVLVAGPRNAATDLIGEWGGLTVPTASPDVLGDAIVAVICAGEMTRRQALANADRLRADCGVAATTDQLLALTESLSGG